VAFPFYGKILNEILGAKGIIIKLMQSITYVLYFYRCDRTDMYMLKEMITLDENWYT